jgi:hypothetical protein
MPTISSIDRRPRTTQNLNFGSLDIDLDERYRGPAARGHELVNGPCVKRTVIELDEETRMKPGQSLPCRSADLLFDEIEREGYRAYDPADPTVPLCGRMN